MPAVSGDVRLLQERNTEVRETAWPQAVRFAEIVLRAGALNGLSAIDIDNLIAFAPPAAIIVLHAQDAAEQVAAAFGLKHQIRAGGGRSALAILRVEGTLVFLRLAVRAVVDLEPVLAWLLAFVSNCQPGGAPEWHRDVAIAGGAARRRIGERAGPLIDGHQRGT